MDDDKKPSRRHRGDKPAPPTAWWMKQFQDRPIATVSTLASATGGLILLWFFCVLGESPDLDLASFGAVPMAIALVGFAVAAALTGCAFAAGLTLRGKKKGLAGLNATWTASYLIVPSMVGVVTLTTYLALSPNGKWTLWVMWLPFILMLLCAIGIASSGSKPLEEEDVAEADRNKRWPRLERFGELFGVGIIWVLIAYFALFTFWALFPRGDRTNSEFLLGTLCWTLLCYALNLMVGWAPKNLFTVLPVSIGFGLLGLLSTSGNWVGFPRAVVGALGMGEMPVSLIVNAEGCDALNKRAGDRVVCRIAASEKSAVVCPAILRSRIGSPFFVGLSAYEDRGSWPQRHPPKRLEAISVPKADVLSWSRLDNYLAEATAAAASAASAPAGIATFLNAKDKGTWLRTQCGQSPADAPAPADSAPAGRVSAGIGLRVGKRRLDTERQGGSPYETAPKSEA